MQRVTCWMKLQMLHLSILGCVIADAEQFVWSLRDGCIQVQHLIRTIFDAKTVSAALAVHWPPRTLCCIDWVVRQWQLTPLGCHLENSLGEQFCRCCACTIASTQW